MLRALLPLTLLVPLALSACTSREEKLRRLKDKREVLFVELRELPGYFEARAEVVKELQTPSSPMERMQQLFAPDPLRPSEHELGLAVDATFRKFCLALGSLRADGKKDPAFERPGPLKSFFDAATTEQKCREVWDTELESRAILKGG